MPQGMRGGIDTQTWDGLWREGCFPMAPAQRPSGEITNFIIALDGAYCRAWEISPPTFSALRRYGRADA